MQSLRWHLPGILTSIPLRAQASCLRLGKESGQHIADEVDEPVADHVGHKVAAPDEKEREHAAEHESDEDVGPATGPMADAEDQ